jgi:D-alanyl-D-alanine dipeptidase
MRYATARNFTGAPVPGYEGAECILTQAAAEALARAQAKLREQRLGLKVYDCYRPERAVRAFVKWVRNAGKGEPSHYPNVARRDLISAGYIASRSGHSTGTAVDLTLVTLAPPASEHQPATGEHHGSCLAPAREREADDSLDMGTGYDCFDPRSHTRAKGLSAEQKRLRAVLVDAMAAAGFVNYPKEWWHFSLRDGGDGASFDVPVTARRKD